MSRGISFSNCVKGEASPILLTVQGELDMLLIVSRGAKSHSIDCPGGAAY